MTAQCVRSTFWYECQRTTLKNNVTLLCQDAREPWTVDTPTRLRGTAHGLDSRFIRLTCPPNPQPDLSFSYQRYIAPPQRCAYLPINDPLDSRQSDKTPRIKSDPMTSSYTSRSRQSSRLFWGISICRHIFKIFDALFIAYPLFRLIRPLEHCRVPSFDHHDSSSPSFFHSCPLRNKPVSLPSICL